MAVTDIKLRRRKANVPDVLAGTALSLNILYREINFPLTDENGNVLLSDQVTESGVPIPQYYDFVVSIPVPSPIPTGAVARQAFIDDLKAQADLQAKRTAQSRATLIIDRGKINSIVRAINDDTGIIFEGTFTEP